MSYRSPYVREIKCIKAELVRLAKRTKELRQQKLAAEARLREHMLKEGLVETDGITLKSITPKNRPKRKSKKQAERDARETLREHGVDDTEKVWTKLKKINIIEEQKEEM